MKVLTLKAEIRLLDTIVPALGEPVTVFFGIAEYDFDNYSSYFNLRVRRKEALPSIEEVMNKIEAADPIFMESIFYDEMVKYFTQYLIDYYEGEAECLYSEILVEDTEE